MYVMANLFVTFSFQIFQKKKGGSGTLDYLVIFKKTSLNVLWTVGRLTKLKNTDILKMRYGEALHLQEINIALLLRFLVVSDCV